VCDHRSTILLDSGSDTSILGLDLARRLGLSLSHKEKLKVKGIGGITTYVTARARVKITLGMSVVYYTDIWCGNIGDSTQCLLGMDFMVSAGVRLNTFEGMVKLPDEESVPLVSSGVRPSYPKKAPVCAPSALHIAPGMSVMVPVIYRRTDPDLVMWLRRGKN
jgi:hypothetical protein